MKIAGALRMALVLTTGLWTTTTVAHALPVKAAPAVTPKRAEKETSTTGFLIKTLKQGEKNYRYVLYVPADYDASKAYPTILFLHGAGECGKDGLKQVAVGLPPAVMLNAEKWPFLILIPQKPDVRDTWLQHDDALMAMLDATKRDYKVDTSRLYLTGLSQGGYGTWGVGAKHADLFAAIAPVCGWGESDMAPKLKNMPIWAFHGDQDTAVKLERGQEMIKLVKDAGGSATITVYPGVGHNSWDKAYRDEKLYDWFLKYKKEAK